MRLFVLTMCQLVNHCFCYKNETSMSLKEIYKQHDFEEKQLCRVCKINSFRIAIQQRYRSERIEHVSARLERSLM